MAYNKNDKADGAKFRRGGMRRRKKVCVFCGEKNGTIDYKDVNKLKDMSLKEEKFFRDVLQVTVQSIREHLPLQSREQDTSLLCLIQWNKPLFYKDFANEIP